MRQDKARLAGRNRWAARNDRHIADILQVQNEINEIAARVVFALQVGLAPGELQRLTRTYVINVEAYDPRPQRLPVAVA